VLIVESEHDTLVPRQVIRNYMGACAQAQSLTYRLITAADHALSEPAWQQTYTALLVNWMTEMVLSARGGKTGVAALTTHAKSAQRTPGGGD